MIRSLARLVLLAMIALSLPRLGSAQVPTSDSAAYLKKRAERIMSQLDFAQARRHLERAIGLYPKDADFRMLLGEVHFALEQRTAAIKAFEEGVKLAPAMIARIPNYPLALVNEGRLDEAREVYARALEIARDDSGRGQAEFGLGLVRYHRGDLDGAAEHLERALEKLPDSKKVRYRLALVRRAKGELDVARTLLEKVVASDGMHEPAIHNLAMIAVQSKDRPAAQRWRDRHRSVRAALVELDQARRALAKSPGNLAILRRIADIYFEHRRFDDAQGPYSWLVTQMPLDPEPRYRFAMCHFGAGRFHEARIHLQHVLRMAPEHPGATRAMAEIVERFGRKDG